MTIQTWAKSYGRGAISYLARRTGLTYVAASSIVKGKSLPRPENANKISRATGCSFEDLCGPAAQARVRAARLRRAAVASEPATVPDPGAGLRAAAAALGVDPDAETGDVVRALESGPTEAA